MRKLFTLFYSLIFIFSYGEIVFSEQNSPFKLLDKETSRFIKENKLDNMEKEDLNRFILDSFSLGNDLFMENSSNKPILVDWMKNNRKIFGDNPTVRYQSFFLNKGSEYIIKGSLKNLEFVTFQVYSLKNNQNIPTNIISSKDFKNINKNTYEIIVSSKKYPNKNSLLIVPEDYIIIVREFYKDDSIKDKNPTSITIEEIPDIKNSPRDNSKKAMNFIQGAIISTYNLYDQLNENSSGEIDNKYKIALFSTKGNYYEGEVIELLDDEIYEITVSNLPKNYNFIWTFYNILSRTPDYKKYSIYLNEYNTQYDSENSYKFYLSKKKIPNLKNSMETGGYSRGILSLRISQENIPEDFDYSIKKLKINQITSIN